MCLTCCVWKHPFIYIASGAGVGPGSGFAGVGASALRACLACSWIASALLFCSEGVLECHGGQNHANWRCCVRKCNIYCTCSLADSFKNQYGNSHIRILFRTSENHKTVSYVIVYKIIYLYSNKLYSIVIFYKQHIKTYVLSKTLNFSYMFRSLSDHPQRDTIFVLTSVTKIIDVEVKKSIVSPWGWSLSDRNM